jgi:NADPH:quinone reductase-like Zn-dependent oxidoreductase
MKAIVQDVHGSAGVLRLRAAGRPPPGSGEVRVRAAGAGPGVRHLMTGVPCLMRVTGSGFRRPKVPVRGLALAGAAAAAGPGMTRFQPGDEVSGTCRSGSFAGYAAARQDRLAPRPASLSFGQAAALPASALTALQAVPNQANAQAGQRVLITGAGGGTGTFAVQPAKTRGASVTVACGPAKADLARSTGAGTIIDCTREETDRGADRYDVIIDIAGNRPLSLLRRALAPRGTLVLTGGGRHDRPALTGISRPARAPFLSMLTGQRLRALPARENAADYQALARLAGSGALTPVTGRTCPLADAADAIRHIAAGHATGKGIITI